MGVATQFAGRIGNIFASKPKSSFERYEVKGALVIVPQLVCYGSATRELEPRHRPETSPEPEFGHEREPEHPEDKYLFWEEGHEPIVLPVEDDLGPLPPIPSEVPGRLLDCVPVGDIPLGAQEVKNLLNELCDKLAGDSELEQQSNVLRVDCINLFEHIQETKPSSPKVNIEIARIGRELANTLPHLISRRNRNQLVERVHRQSIIQRLVQCETAYTRLRDHVAWIQNMETYQMIRKIESQRPATMPNLTGFQEILQANEAEIQSIIQRETAGDDVPREIILSQQIKYRQDAAICTSRRFSVYKGEMMSGAKIAIKVSEFMPRLDGGRNFGREMLRRAFTWASLDSKYILPFLGMGVQIVKGQGQGSDHYKVFFLSPWVTDGNAIEYIRGVRSQFGPQRRRVDISKIVRDMALGLQYLHQRDEPCIHGSLRGENVLIKMDGGMEQACLNGFGLTKEQWRAISLAELGYEGRMCRWRAPEILNCPSGGLQMDPSSDIWSWAMTALELYSSKEPYHQCVEDQHIMTLIASGEVPSRGLYPDFDKYAPQPDATWALFEQCWKKDPNERPTIQGVLNELDRINAM